MLRVGGVLVLMWNRPAGPWTPSTAAVEALLRERLPEVDPDYDPLDLGGPRRGDRNWRGSFASAGFEPLRDARIANPQTLDRTGLAANFASMGWIADLPDEARLPLLGAVRSRLTTNEYRRTWTTDIYWTRLLATSA